MTNVRRLWARLDQGRERQSKNITPSDKNTSTANQKREQVPVQPVFSDVGIFYDYVFDLGEYVDPIEAARSLLTTDLGLCAINYLTKEIEIAARFKSSLTLQQNMDSLRYVNSLQETDGIQGIAKWALKNPKRAIRLWRMMREVKTRKKSTAEPTEKPEASGGWTIPDLVEETAGFIEQSMAEMQAFMKLLMDSDSILFSPTYLASAPFVRVELQPVDVSIDGNNHQVKVAVLLHRSGLGILTFYALFGGDKTVDDLNKLSKPSSVGITESKVVRTIVEYQWRASGRKISDLDDAPIERGLSSGVEWFVQRELAETSLFDVLGAYQNAITSIILRKNPTNPNEPFSWLRTPDWLVYPIIFVRKVMPAALPGNLFKETFSQSLAGLVARFEAWREMRADRVNTLLENDSSAVPHQSFYITEGHTTVLYYGPDIAKREESTGMIIREENWLFDHFQKSSLIDVLLIQRGMLMILREEVSKLPLDLVRLNRLKRRLILSLDEYHGVTVSYGSAQDIIRESRKAMRIDSAYDEVIFKLGGVEKLIDVEESRQRYRRDLFLRIAALAVTVPFGLTGANQASIIISTWVVPSSSGMPRWLEVFLNSFTGFVRFHPVFTTLAIYILVLLIIVPALLWSIWPRKRKEPLLGKDQSSSAYGSRFTWPPSIEGNREEKTSPSETS
jgi:hypothetical protein